MVQVLVIAVLGNTIWGNLVIVLCPRTQLAVVVTKAITRLIKLIVILVPVRKVLFKFWPVLECVVVVTNASLTSHLQRRTRGNGSKRPSVCP